MICMSLATPQVLSDHDIYAEMNRLHAVWFDLSLHDAGTQRAIGA